jgi:hypothetical protein
LGTKQMGDTLGEMALVSSQKRAADVLAISLCELAVPSPSTTLAPPEPEKVVTTPPATSRTRWLLRASGRVREGGR